jgi:hypothetical protein
MSRIALKPMVSSITTIRKYPRGACLHPALLSCIRADIPLFKLKSHDESMKRQKMARLHESRAGIKQSATWALVDGGD